MREGINVDYKALFETLFPNFFQNEGIRSLSEDSVEAEQILWLDRFDPQAVTIPVPEGITFGFYKGPLDKLHEAVRAVDDGWVRYYNENSRVYCAFDGDKVVSFCDLDEMGTYQALRVAGPGCVGTIPSYRRQGIGLRMVQLATEILKQDGYDISFIHYTGVAHWYAKLGYRTVLKWNRDGIVWTAE